MPLLERTSTSRRIGVWSVLGLMLVPLVVAAGFLWATWDAPSRLDRVQAAVVDLDRPVTLGGKTVPLGRQLAGELVSGRHDAVDGYNLGWVVTDAADAAAGLASGSYTAVVTIPADFSARASSFSKTEAAAIQPATIDVRTSDASGVTDPLVGQALTTAATSALNSSLSQEYLKNIYVGFNNLSKQFDTVAKAADKLAGGSRQVTDGLDRTATGTAELADGLGKLHTGSTRLASGADRLSGGSSDLADGLGQLADGAAQLPSGAGKLATGASRSADGAGRLADGADQLAGGVSSLRTGTKEYAAGVQQYADGVKTYQKSVSGIARLSDAQLVKQFPQLCPSPATVQQCAPVLAGFRGGITAALAGFSTTKGGSGHHVPGLVPAAQKLADGADRLDSGVEKLGTGASGLSDGNAALAKGLGRLADGNEKLADGVAPLAKGLGSSADGADRLATGARRLSTGATSLASGVGQSATGAGSLDDGVRKLADGSSKVTSGTQKLADGLARGADAVPTYDRATRQKLSTVVPAPVQPPAPTSAFSDVTTTTLLMVLALWVGALATFGVLRTVTARVLGSMKPSWRLALEGLLPAALIGIVQAAALTTGVALLLDLSASRTLHLGALALLAAVVFAALNQALVACFGGVGRFVSLVVLVLGGAGALTSAVPAALRSLLPFLPLTPALAGLRAAAGGTSGAGARTALLVAWLVVAVAASVLAVSRRRVAAPLPRRAAEPVRA